jgi:hypothetical protein
MNKRILRESNRVITYKIRLFKIWLSLDSRSTALDILDKYPNAIAEIDLIFPDEIPRGNRGYFVDNSVHGDVIREVRQHSFLLFYSVFPHIR